MIRITFACGHHAEVEESVQARPVCHCGETRVQNVNTRPPTFTGACRGPLVKEGSQ